MKIEGELYQSDVDFDNKYSLKLATHHAELLLGEFPATFEGSEFTVFHRSLQGAKLTADWPPDNDHGPKVEVMALASSPRGTSKYDKFFGNNTQGPYQLTAFPIVTESERITVDKQPMVRNTDYEINYLTGSLTFTKRIVEPRSLVEATYETRSTLYPRSLYGGQVRFHPTGDDTLGLLGADERDKLDQSVFAASGTPATAQSALGATYKHDGEFLRFGGEWAHSVFDADEAASAVSAGNAYKGQAEVERFGAKLGGDVKRVQPTFRTMGNTALGSDLLAWSSHGGLGFGKWLALTGVHQQQRTDLNGSTDKQVSTDAKAESAPPGLPKSSYRFYQSDESYLADFNRRDQRHTADLSQSFRHVTVGGGYEHERLTFSDGSQPAQTWNAGKANAGLTGITWLSAAANGEVRVGETSSSLATGSAGFRSLLAGTNVSFTPHQRYSFTADNRWQATTGQPPQNTLQTQGKAKPVDPLSLDASYAQQTLQMAYVGVQHPARQDSVGGTADWQPVKAIELRYHPSFRETVLSGLGHAVNLNRTDEYAAKWSGWSWISAEGTFTLDRYTLDDTSDPGLRVASGQDTDTWKTSLKVAPVPAFTTSLAYADKLNHRDQLDLASPALYDTRGSRDQTASIGVAPQLESRLGINATYQFERFTQGGSQGEATSLPQYQISPLSQQIASYSQQNDYRTIETWEHTVNGSASYQWRKELISTATGAWDLKQDRMGLVPNTETLSAGAGLTYRLKWLKVDGTYKLARSRGGASTLQQSFSGSLDVLPNERVHWTNRAEYSLNAHPASEATDLTSSLEMTF